MLNSFLSLKIKLLHNYYYLNRPHFLYKNLDSIKTLYDYLQCFRPIVETVNQQTSLIKEFKDVISFPTLDPFFALLLTLNREKCYEYAKLNHRITQPADTCDEFEFLLIRLVLKYKDFVKNLMCCEENVLKSIDRECLKYIFREFERSEFFYVNNKKNNHLDDPRKLFFSKIRHSFRNSSSFFAELSNDDKTICYYSNHSFDLDYTLKKKGIESNQEFLHVTVVNDISDLKRVNYECVDKNGAQIVLNVLNSIFYKRNKERNVITYKFIFMLNKELVHSAHNDVDLVYVELNGRKLNNNYKYRFEFAVHYIVFTMEECSEVFQDKNVAIKLRSHKSEHVFLFDKQNCVYEEYGGNGTIKPVELLSLKNFNRMENVPLLEPKISCSLNMVYCVPLNENLLTLKTLYYTHDFNKMDPNNIKHATTIVRGKSSTINFFTDLPFELTKFCRDKFIVKSNTFSPLFVVAQLAYLMFHFDDQCAFLPKNFSNNSFFVNESNVNTNFICEPAFISSVDDWLNAIRLFQIYVKNANNKYDFYNSIKNKRFFTTFCLQNIKQVFVDKFTYSTHMRGNSFFTTISVCLKLNLFDDSFKLNDTFIDFFVNDDLTRIRCPPIKCLKNSNISIQNNQTKIEEEWILDLKEDLAIVDFNTIVFEYNMTYLNTRDHLTLSFSINKQV